MLRTNSFYTLLSGVFDVAWFGVLHHSVALLFNSVKRDTFAQKEEGDEGCLWFTQQAANVLRMALS